MQIESYDKTMDIRLQYALINWDGFKCNKQQYQDDIQQQHTQSLVLVPNMIVDMV